MSTTDAIHRWSMLPGPKWSSVDEARRWLKAERTRLGWTELDVDRAFRSVANGSRLYVVDGGGAGFPRATIARVRRFETRGETIPDWLYWIPLAIQRASIPQEKHWEWDRENIPRRWDALEIEMEQDALAAKEVTTAGIGPSDVDEWELILLVRQMDDEQKEIFWELARQPHVLPAIIDMLADRVDQTDEDA